MALRGNSASAPHIATVIGLGVLRGRHLEEALGERLLGPRAAGRRHREVALVVELAVHREAEQREERPVVLHDDRHRRRDHVGRVAAGDDVDLVDVHQLGVEARYRRGIRLVVVVDELHRPAEQPALGVDLLFPDLHGQQRRLAVGRERAGQVHAEADGERLALGNRRAAIPAAAPAASLPKVRRWMRMT